MTVIPEMTIGYQIKKFRLNRFPDRGGLAKCATQFGVHHQQWRDWESGKRTPGTEYQIKLAAFFGITLGELRGEPNSNQKNVNVLIDKGVTGDITYSEKGAMADSAGVEFLKDHLTTLKQDKADLQTKVALLEKEVAYLREKMEVLQDENKRLLTLSSEKDTTQAGAG